MKTITSPKLKEWQRMFIIIRSNHSFRKIKTWRDYLKAIGLSDGHIEYAYEQTQLNRNISWDECKKNLEAIKENLEIQAEEEQLAKRDSNTYVIAGSDSNRSRELLPDKYRTKQYTPIAHEYPIGNFYEPRRQNRDDVNVYTYREQRQLPDSNDKIELPREIIELPFSPKEKASLFMFQKRGCKELLDNLFIKQLRAQCLIAGAGLGKTFIIGAFLRRVLDSGWLDGRTFSPWPIIYVTKAPIVTQTERVLQEYFGIDIVSEVLVINIEQLRSRFGQMFVNEKTIIENGEEKIKFIWRKNIYPALICLDECQGVKNVKSIQSQIFQSYNEIDSPNTFQVYFSATPLTKVDEAKCLVVATRMKSKKASFSGEPLLVTNKTWNLFATNVASPADPKEHSPAAVERLMKELMPYVVDIKGVRPQFRAINKVEIVEFETPEDKAFYDSAWERWLKDKARFEAEQAQTGTNMGMCILAAFTKFRQAAELCKAKMLARRAYHKVKEGFAPVIGACFKTTIVRVVSILVNDYKIPRSKISLIWGGKSEGKTKALKKKELRDKLAKHKNFLDELAKMGSSLDELGLTSSDIAELMDEEAERLNASLGSTDLQLGSQSKAERQQQLDNFQMGRSDILIFTGKAGGVGLSAHHCDDLLDPIKVHEAKEWLRVRYKNRQLSPKLLNIVDLVFDNKQGEAYKSWCKFNDTLNDDEHRAFTRLLKVRRKEDSNYAVVEDIPFLDLRPRSLDATPVYSAIELVQIFGRCPRLTSLSDTQQSMLFFAGTIEVEVAASVSMKLKCLKKVVRQKEHWEDLILKTVSDYNYKKAREMIPDDEQIYSQDDGTELFGGEVEEDDENGDE